MQGGVQSNGSSDGRSSLASATSAASPTSTGHRSFAKTRTSNGVSIQVKWRPSISRDGVVTHTQTELTMAVAKRLLPRAIDRNRFRRVVREAWRQRVRELRTSAAAEASALPATVFVRLVRRSVEWRSLPEGQLKRVWRQEIDRLLAVVSGANQGKGAG